MCGSICLSQTQMQYNSIIERTIAKAFHAAGMSGNEWAWRSPHETDVRSLEYVNSGMDDPTSGCGDTTLIGSNSSCLRTYFTASWASGTLL